MRLAGRHAVVLAAALLVTLAVPNRLPAAGYEEGYRAGMALFNRGKYIQAIRQFRAMLEQSRTSSLSDNCQYWIGESYYQLGQYEQALMEFDDTLTFPHTNKREDALFKIAQCHEKLGEPEQARAVYLRFLADFPASRHVPLVMKKLDTLGIP